MPIQPTYPGVYIEELPSGVHTITGVPTSVTAFLGRASQGPANEQIIVTSYADFERTFGGLGVDYAMSYAVRDFYLNGGSEAVIVRLFKSAVAGSDGTATIDLGNGLKLQAIGPGTWANKLQATVNTDSITDQIAQSYGLQKSDLFNLIIQNDPANNGPREIFRNLSVVNGPRRIDYVLNSSQFMRVATPYPAAPQVPASGTTAASGRADSALLTGSLDFLGDPNQKTGMYALDRADIFNLLCIPPDTRDGDIDSIEGGTIYTTAMAYCQQRRAFLIVDAPPGCSKISRCIIWRPGPVM